MEVETSLPENHVKEDRVRELIPSEIILINRPGTAKPQQDPNACTRAD